MEFLLVAVLLYHTYSILNAASDRKIRLSASNWDIAGPYRAIIGKTVDKLPFLLDALAHGISKNNFFIISNEWRKKYSYGLLKEADRHETELVKKSSSYSSKRSVKHRQKTKNVKLFHWSRPPCQNVLIISATQIELKKCIVWELHNDLKWNLVCRLFCNLHVFLY